MDGPEMDDAPPIYGPKPGQPPVFTIDDVHVFAAEVAGMRAVLTTAGADADKACAVTAVLITKLVDWLGLADLAVSEDHYREFHRLGTMTPRPSDAGEWLFTFNADPTGTVTLYPIPHKNTTTVTGQLIVPRAPVLFTAPSIDTGHLKRGSDEDQFAHHLKSLLALHRIDARVSIVEDDRTYHTPGRGRLTARVYAPTGYATELDGHTGDAASHDHWVLSVLEAANGVPQMSAHVTESLSGTGSREVIMEYHRPRRPWITDESGQDS
jgi:hypothetical protein